MRTFKGLTVFDFGLLGWLCLVAAERAVVGSGWYRIRLLLLVTVVVDADPDRLGFDMELGSRCITSSMRTLIIYYLGEQMKNQGRSLCGAYLLQTKSTNLFGSLWFVVVRTYHPNRRINPDKWPLGRKRGSLRLHVTGFHLDSIPLSSRTEGKSKWLLGPSQYTAWKNNLKLCAIWRFLAEMN